MNAATQHVAPVAARRLLRMLAPTLAVGVFWFGLQNAWLTILAYHLQIWLWSRHRLGSVWRGRKLDATALAALATGAAAGPSMYFLLPHLTRSDLHRWLASYGLAGDAFLLMIPYFAIVNPILEQAHWHDLRNETRLAHVFFAAYHVLLLSRLLSPLWLGISCVVLVAISCIWYGLARRREGSFVPCCMHVLADIGIVLAAWLRVRAA